MTRAGSDAAALLDRPGSLLHTHRANVSVVEEPVANEISSSLVSVHGTDAEAVQTLYKV